MTILTRALINFLISLSSKPSSRSSSSVSDRKRSTVICSAVYSTIYNFFYVVDFDVLQPCNEFTIKFNLQGEPKHLAPFFLYALTLRHINQFSKLFHCQNLEKICNNTITKDPTTSQVCRYTIPCEMPVS